MADHIYIKMISRVGCHLCEGAKRDMARVLKHFRDLHPEADYSFHEVDISDQVDYERFNDDLPVVMVNDEVIAKWRINDQEFLDKLEALV